MFADKLLSALDKKIAEDILSFTNALSKEINVRQVILFGSQATGKAHKWSDIDLVVISDDFESRSRAWRKSTLSRIAIRAKTFAIQAMGFSSNEWSSTKPIDFAGIIKAYGLVVLDNVIENY
jgi:predicted nucleotidyltransferase